MMTLQDAVAHGLLVPVEGRMDKWECARPFTLETDNEGKIIVARVGEWALTMRVNAAHLEKGMLFDVSGPGELVVRRRP